jgi:hypothetical protein
MPGGKARMAGGQSNHHNDDRAFFLNLCKGFFYFSGLIN